MGHSPWINFRILNFHAIRDFNGKAISVCTGKRESEEPVLSVSRICLLSQSIFLNYKFPTTPKYVNSFSPFFARIKRKPFLVVKQRQGKMNRKLFTSLPNIKENMLEYTICFERGSGDGKMCIRRYIFWSGRNKLRTNHTFLMRYFILKM